MDWLVGKMDGGVGGVSSRGRGSGLRGAALCGSGSGAQDGPRAARTHCCSGELRCAYYGMAVFTGFILEEEEVDW